MRLWVFALIAIVAAAVLFSIVGPGSRAQAAEQESGLSGVRLRGSRPILEKVAEEAAKVRWTESSFDTKGRLTLKAPKGYKSDDFGQLLGAIDQFKSEIDGLQMLGPNGGPVDDQGIEHPDD
jgi:hypothetical protein